MDATSKELASQDQTLLEAVAWQIRLAEKRVDTSVEFETWLERSPRHRAAWRQVRETWAFFGDQAASPELLTARQQALRRGQMAAVRRGRPRFVSSRLLTSALAATLVLASLAAIFILQHARWDVYRTGPGERRTVTLADGSRISLDAQTEVRVRLGSTARELELPSGQARFDVAHDVQRPFSVVAGGEKVVATGTAFNIDLLGPRLLITLIEGRVVVLSLSTNNLGDLLRLPRPSEPPRYGPGSVQQGPAPTQGASKGTPSARAIEMSPGEQLALAPGRVPDLEKVKLGRALAWQNGQLVCEDEPLSSVVARINRYASLPIAIADARTAELRISGVFNTDDVHRFVAIVAQYLPVDADEQGGHIWLRHR